MKKGLRRVPRGRSEHEAGQNRRPDEEGIKTEGSGVLFRQHVRTVDLMKKGLRLGYVAIILVSFCQNRRPDEEGIKTDWPSPNRPLKYRQNRRPDEEGIKTPVGNGIGPRIVRTVDLMKKGLRPSLS